MSMPFWTKHSEEMRKARLLAASAIMFAQGKFFYKEDAVTAALELEKIVNDKLNKESK